MISTISVNITANALTISASATNSCRFIRLEENLSETQEIRKKLDRITESTGFPRQFLLSCVPQRFRFAQLPTRSSAFSMFSIELATLNRK